MVVTPVGVTPILEPPWNESSSTSGHIIRVLMSVSVCPLCLHNLVNQCFSKYHIRVAKPETKVHKVLVNITWYFEFSNVENRDNRTVSLSTQKYICFEISVT